MNRRGFCQGLGDRCRVHKTGSILGPPSSVTQGEFGGPVTPFSPPYLLDQILSIGKGGQVTVKFDRPIRNESLNPLVWTSLCSVQPASRLPTEISRAAE